MRLHAKFIFVANILMMATLWPSRADETDDAKIRQSLVKIFATLRRPDLYRPWTKTSPQEVTGSGVVLAGNRVLTNAHLVGFASQVFVQPDKSSEKVSASVLMLAPGIDLALLKLEDDTFFASHSPLPFNPKLPSLQQNVAVYGYPEGGSELSITRGIVSRVEYTDYYYGTSGVRIQVDAAINPGNSGGPAVVDGRMVGITFSRLQSADNIGYLIPVEEIDLFLKDIQDGAYDGKPELGVDTQRLESAVLRNKFKLSSKTTGILVRRIHHRDTSFPLRVEDIITHIGDYVIDNAGMVHGEGDRLIKFKYLIQRLAHDGKLSLTIMRNNLEQQLEVPVSPDLHRWLFPALALERLSYFVYGPLVFTEATDDYVRSVSDESNVLGLISSRDPIYARYGDLRSFPDEHIVIVAYPIFTHKMGKGYEDPYTHAVAKVNGVHIRNLKHFVEVLRDATDEFTEFTFHGNFTDEIVFKHTEALEATAEILNDNGIRQQYSPDIAPIWNQKKAK